MTSVACQQPSTNETQIIGEPFYSTICGGGLYNLTSLNNNDLIVSPDFGITHYSLRPCAAVTTGDCATGTSFCQYFATGFGWPNGIAGWSGPYSYYTSTTPIWTLTADGLMLQLADGSICTNSQPNVAILSFICNPNAAQAILLNVSQSPACHFTAIIETIVVCGPPSSANMTFSATTPTIVAGGPTSTSCGGAGFDLSSLTTKDYVWTGPQFDQYWMTYALRPCGHITTSGCYGPSMMCQVNEGITVSVWTPSSCASQWLPTPNGVQMVLHITEPPIR